MKTYFIFIFIAFSFLHCYSQSDKGVFADDFCRNTFYTWTTSAQIADIKANKVLLTKSKSETKGYSLFDMSLRDSTLKNDTLARLLLQPEFAKKRFAWTNSWATVMGWEKEKYGDQLIKIVISDSAIIGKFDADAEETITFYNMKGEKLNTKYVLENKNRIAVVYHVTTRLATRSEYKVKRKHTFYTETKKIETKSVQVPYREYVIVNESMITSWSYGTDEIKGELKHEVDLLKEFAGAYSAKQNAFSSFQYKDWTPHREGMSQEEKYRSMICFQNNYYLFNKKRIDTIIEALQQAALKQNGEIKK